MTFSDLPMLRPPRVAWNKGRIVGQKRPLLPKHVWAIRVRLELAGNVRDLALFNMAVDSKLRGCDLVRLKVADVVVAGRVKERASIIQSKTLRPVQFEIVEGTRQSLLRWVESRRCSVPSIAGPLPRSATHLDTPIRPHAQGLGRLDRP